MFKELEIEGNANRRKTMDYKLTYFTSTYNREDLLPNLYNSLLRQTNKNFIWLIVDDGSKDKTPELVAKWQKENKLNIEYIYKENGGKNSAMEIAFAKCSTDYVCIVDSDDYVSEDSTEVIYKYIPMCGENVVGMVGRRAHYDGKPFNDSWPKNEEELYFRDLKEKYGYSQDTNLIFKTNIIKNFHFPKIEGERFITESVFYNQFLNDYKLLAIPECIYLAEYQEVGYTSQGINLFFKNPKGYLYAVKQKHYYNKKNKKSFKTLVHGAAIYYAWKSVLKLKDKFKNDYKIKFPYNLFGWGAQILLIPSLHKKYKQFKKNEKDK